MFFSLNIQQFQNIYSPLFLKSSAASELKAGGRLVFIILSSQKFIPITKVGLNVPKCLEIRGRCQAAGRMALSALLSRCEKKYYSSDVRVLASV